MKKLLFVCLGNICRSPSAEGVMKSLIKNEELEKKYFCDSAGTYGGHTGEPADHRMRQYALKRGYSLTSISRQIRRDDFIEFDYIIVMDESNLQDVKALDTKEVFGDKIVKMTQFCATCSADIVPDPYYGGSDGFEEVLDILEDACKGLLDQLESGVL